MTYCVVIPTYNNARTVADIVRRTLAVCNDVIVVNDGSTDNTIAELQPFGSSIRLISYSTNCGKGYALRRGLEAARAAGFDYAVTIDSDGQHRPEEIPLLIQAIKQSDNQATLVVGSRTCPTHRRDSASTLCTISLASTCSPTATKASWNYSSFRLGAE